MMKREVRIAMMVVAVLVLASYWAMESAGAPPMDAKGGVTGSVRLDGTAPKPAHIVMSADENCTKAHPGGTNAEDVVLGPNNALANVVVYVSDASGGGSAPPSTAATLEQKGCVYEPHVIAVQANQKIKIVNADGTTHNIHPLPQNNREWNKSQPPGMAPVEESFPREEIAIPVKCNVHPWMKSYIAVFKHPYFAVTSKDGSFNIANLPPGTYTLQAWHEKLGTQTKKITVGPNGAAEKVEFVFKGR